MEFLRIVGLVTCIILPTSYAQSVNTYEMGTSNGTTVRMTQGGARIVMTDGTEQIKDGDYILIVEARNSGGTLAIVITELDLSSNPDDCGNKYLELLDGSDPSSPALPGLKKRHLCGSSEPGGIFQTNQKYLRIHLRAIGLLSRDSFEILVAVTHSGTCAENETDCKDAGCVGHQAIFHGFPCIPNTGNPGGSTNEPSTIAIAAFVVALVAIGSVIALALGIAIYCLLCRRQNYQRQN